MAWSRRRMIVAGLVGALLAAIVTVIALDFVAGEKQIERKLEHRYTIDGNRVTNLESGIEIFPAMLEAVRSARHNVNFETYIYWSGDIGREFAEALSERAPAGVEVQVLIDWVGSQKMEQALLDLMVVDGAVGFTGGVGIADNWDGDATAPDHWRDSHYRLEGPAVAQMQAAFMDN